MIETDPTVKATAELDLVGGLLRRDPAALELLYERYSHRIFRFLYRMTRDRIIADDLHQDTWLAAARHATRLRADSDLSAWLFTIARNKHLSWRRWSILARRSERILGAGAEAACAPISWTRMDGSASLRDVERALMRLSSPLREVLLLVGCEGLDTAQTADVLAIHPDAVRQRLARARARVREIMDAEDEVGEARQRRRSR